MTKYLYMFKASGLQRYIFATQPLREAIGASQLIIELTEDYLPKTLKKLGIDDRCKTIQRAAGSAILEFDDEESLRKLYALWPLLVGEIAPGLVIDQWAVERSANLFADLQRGWDALRAKRNIAPPPLPEVAPVVRRSEDSGQAAVAANPSSRSGVVDAASLRKLNIADAHQGSAAGVQTQEVNPSWEHREWAQQLSHIAHGEDSFMAVIHADGNRIGGFLIEVARSIDDADLSDDEVGNFYGDFATALNESTKKAVIDALQCLEEDDDDAAYQGDTLPARPVVVGGDDVTLIVPADRAVAIVERFLQAFEEHTTDMIDDLRQDYGSVQALSERDHFTACAGIVFQKQKYPLLQGYELSEHLCGFAKKEGAKDNGTTISGLVFRRLLDSDHSDQDQWRRADYVSPKSQVRVMAGPYALEEGQELIPLSKLRQISKGLDEGRLATNSARQIIDELHQDYSMAKASFDRAEYIGGTSASAFAKQLGEACESRERKKRGFKDLSILPDAAILNKMEIS